MHTSAVLWRTGARIVVGSITAYGGVQFLQCKRSIVHSPPKVHGWECMQDCVHFGHSEFFSIHVIEWRSLPGVYETLVPMV